MKANEDPQVARLKDRVAELEDVVRQAAKALDPAASSMSRELARERIAGLQLTEVTHQHVWIDATNSVVSNTEICLGCGSFRPMPAGARS